MTIAGPAPISSPSEISAAETTLPRWQPATWEDYCALRDQAPNEHWRLFFDENSVLVTDVGWEGIDHASYCDLFTMILFAWFSKHPEQRFTSLGRCLMEKKPLKAGAPDLVVYLGDDYPKWNPGEKRRINLHQWRVPDLIGEISDTTLATDMDEKKRLYGSLGIGEYWVIDVRGRRIFMFVLDGDGVYQEREASQVLTGLSVALLEQTVQRMADESNGQAALWFSQQL